MKNFEIEKMMLVNLTSDENMEITGGCLPFFCLGKIVEFFCKFGEGFMEGLNEGLGDGKEAA